MPASSLRSARPPHSRARSQSSARSAPATLPAPTSVSAATEKPGTSTKGGGAQRGAGPQGKRRRCGTDEMMSIAKEKPASLAARLWVYQAERFPLASYVPLVATFTFSAAAYSRLARGAPGFIPWPRFVVGVLTALVFFFMLRVLDEHKDAEQDRRFRPELPVPRGLVSLAELRAVGGAACVLVLLLNVVIAPVLLFGFAAFTVWAALMTREFFVRDWLRAHLGAYLVTHMLVMPMIDF